MKALFAALKARWRPGRKPREVLVRRTLHGPQRRKWGWEGGGPHRLPLTPPLPVAAVQLGALWKSPSSQTPPVLPGISSARPRPRGPETQQLRAQRQLRGPQSGPGGTTTRAQGPAPVGWQRPASPGSFERCHLSRPPSAC